MPSYSPLLKKTLQHNHHLSNTTTLDAILASLMAPLQIDSYPPTPQTTIISTEGYDPLDSVMSWFPSPPFPFDGMHCDDSMKLREKGYDSQKPGLSIPPPSFLSMGPGKMMGESMVHASQGVVGEEEYDPAEPGIRGTLELLPCQPSCFPYAPPTLTALPPQFQPFPHNPLPASISSTSLPPSPNPPTKTSTPTPAPNLDPIERGKSQSRKGDRRRLDAVKQRRIERLRAMRGRGSK